LRFLAAPKGQFLEVGVSYHQKKHLSERGRVRASLRSRTKTKKKTSSALVRQGDRHRHAAGYLGHSYTRLDKGREQTGKRFIPSRGSERRQSRGGREKDQQPKGASIKDYLLVRSKKRSVSGELNYPSREKARLTEVGTHTWSKDGRRATLLLQKTKKKNPPCGEEEDSKQKAGRTGLALAWGFLAEP